MAATALRQESSFLSTILSRTILAHAVAGSIGGMIAMSICYPLDRVRTLAQVRKEKSTVHSLLLEVIKEDGWKGLYEGLGPVLVALGSSNFIYFYWYTALKVALKRIFNMSGELSGISNLIVASIAGSINVLITAPLWVVVTRLAIQSKVLERANREKGTLTHMPKYTGMVSAFKQIAQEEGVGALWSGTVPSLILVSNPSVQFASYERLKQILIRVRDSAGNIKSSQNMDDPLTALDYMVLGALAKMIATIVTYPLQVAQTKIRAETSEVEENGKKRKLKYKGTLDCLLTLFNTEGFSGLYRGMDAKILQTCSTSAFMFVFYEKINSIILNLILKKGLKNF